MATAFTSAGIATCSGCQALIPNGLVIVNTGIHDFCPVCAPKYIEKSSYEAAMDDLIKSTILKINK